MAKSNVPNLIRDSRYIDFVKRYSNNLNRFAKEVANLDLTYQQFELMKSVAPFGSRTTVSSGHGTGKTKSYGVIALWHLLCFHGSITAIIAPNIMQVRKQVFKEIAITLNAMKKGPFAWLADEVELLSEECFVKGAKAYWHILAKTAPKNEPENLAGLHGDFLLIIVDEASGVEDSHFGVLTGALTDKRNRMVLASQPTRNVGFFYDTHHRLSKDFGGSWNNLTFNSEYSPIVSFEFLKEKKAQYSKEQYAIKVRGEFPDKTDGFLLGRTDVDKCFGYNPIGEDEDYGYVIPVDVGGGDFRDDTVMTVAKVIGFSMFGKDARRVYIDSIPLMDNSQNTIEASRQVFRLSQKYSNRTLAVDKGGMGTAFIHNLEDLGESNVHKVVWGNPCFSKEYKDQFVNLRTQAFLGLARAIQEGRFGISNDVSDKFRSRITNELTRIPYDYDSRARYQIMSKADMKSRGIPSPDIADTFAFLFLENVQYISAERDEIQRDLEVDIQKKFDEKFGNLVDFFGE